MVCRPSPRGCAGGAPSEARAARGLSEPSGPDGSECACDEDAQLARTIDLEAEARAGRCRHEEALAGDRELLDIAEGDRERVTPDQQQPARREVQPTSEV